MSASNTTSSWTFAIFGVLAFTKGLPRLLANLMAQHNLRAAAASAERHPGRARGLDIDAEEMATWRGAAEAISHSGLLHPPSPGPKVPSRPGPVVALRSVRFRRSSQRVSSAAALVPLRLLG